MSIKLLFAPPFPEILFNGDKYKTFRVSGGDRYNTGDLISLCDVSGEEFATAIVGSKIRKKFKDLNQKDWEGHERFESEEKMYETYSHWQRYPVNAETELDIIEYNSFKITNHSLVRKLSQKN